MTQLVELQKVAGELAEHGFSLFAISNDTVEILSDFASAHDVSFPLLADEESSVIRAFGIQNQLIEPDEGRSMRWHGIAYPGTYFLGPDGKVVDKEFHQHHARRASGPAVLARALGRAVETDSETAVEAVGADDALSAGDGAVKVRAALTEPVLRLEVISRLVVEVEIPQGRHVYAPGSPEAFTPVSVDVSGGGLRVGEAEWPDPVELAMPELDLVAPTYEGTLRLEFPITATSEVIRLGHEVDSHAEIAIDVRYQSCDAVGCGLPQQLALSVEVPLDRLVEPEGLAIYAGRVEALEAETGEPVT